MSVHVSSKPELARLHFGAGPISALQENLLPDEACLLQDENPARAHETVAGRTLARRVMAGMKLPPAEILRAPSGAPVWPVGLCGSISHSRTRAAVVLGCLADWRAVGIDIVDERPLGNGVGFVATPGEIDAFISCSFASEPEHAARQIFSAKEALFKCQAPITGNQDLEFLAVCLNPGSDGVVRAAPNADLDAITAETVGKISVIFEEIQGVIVAIATITGGPK